MAQGRPLRDGLLLAFGTFTVLRVPPPRTVDAAVARTAMLLAPLVGAVLACASAVVAAVPIAVRHDRTTATAALAAVLAVATLAWLTRALHLDGLADTADGLGVKGVDDDVVRRRLAVMRAPDVGAFGVVAVTLVLLVDVVALVACLVPGDARAVGYAAAALLVAVASGRLAATVACTRGVPSARPDGLGAAVAGTVPRAAAAGWLVLVSAVAVAFGGWTAGVRGSVALALAVVVGQVVAALLLRRCVRRFGGVTGDVLGAVVETATAAALVVAALH